MCDVLVVWGACVAAGDVRQSIEETSQQHWNTCTPSTRSLDLSPSLSVSVFVFALKLLFVCVTCVQPTVQLLSLWLTSCQTCRETMRDDREGGVCGLFAVLNWLYIGHTYQLCSLCKLADISVMHTHCQLYNNPAVGQCSYFLSDLLFCPQLFVPSTFKALNGLLWRAVKKLLTQGQPGLCHVTGPGQGRQWILEHRTHRCCLSVCLSVCHLMPRRYTLMPEMNEWMSSLSQEWLLFTMLSLMLVFDSSDINSFGLSTVGDRAFVSCYSRSAVEQSSIARHCCPLSLSIFCCHLKSHILFSLSYPAFWLFSHLYNWCPRSDLWSCDHYYI